MHINDLVIRTLEHVIDAVPYLQAVVSAGSATVMVHRAVRAARRALARRRSGGPPTSGPGARQI
ncbi:hypothetical protein EES37_18230 [Streptomyces sp. ADI91-18]|uniref:hypothetical protein n=1 Tax=Streptomyces sp. ADI91-18 TaxID=1522755 RepID=UPI000F54E3ED|nr:hypothetical protein [Streptomyces sp. ADI91-18]RPK42781.1 hypothetical protein EES37_18230 [Streptomyces sp. ADI91-18]